MSVLGKVEGEKAVVQPETTPAGKKKKHSAVIQVFYCSSETGCEASSRGHHQPEAIL